MSLLWVRKVSLLRENIITTSTKGENNVTAMGENNGIAKGANSVTAKAEDSVTAKREHHHR